MGLVVHPEVLSAGTILPEIEFRYLIELKCGADPLTKELLPHRVTLVQFRTLLLSSTLEDPVIEPFFSALETLRTLARGVHWVAMRLALEAFATGNSDHLAF